MEIKIIAVGKIKDQALCRKIDDYAGRIRHDGKLDFIEIKDSSPELEGVRIIESINKFRSPTVIVLDEKGKEYRSVDFCKKLYGWRFPVLFIIGGPFGLDERVKKSAHELLAISRMTFTHEMARMLLCEQLYRAVSIYHNRGYHKE